MSGDFRAGLVAALPSLRRYARSLTGSDADADDLTQAVVAKAIAREHLFAPGTNLHAWLSVMMSHLHIQEARIEARHRRRLAEIAWSTSLSVPPAQEAARTLAEVVETMPDLPAGSLEALLAEAIGVTKDEAAAQIGVPVGTISSRRWRARTELKEMFA